MKMKPYLLGLIARVNPEADVNDYLVVAAPSASVARRIAAESAEDEGYQAWIDVKDGSCEKIGTAKSVKWPKSSFVVARADNKRRDDK